MRRGVRCFGAGRAVLESHVAAGEDRANTAKPGARKTLENMSKLGSPVKGLDPTVHGKHSHGVGPFDAELMHICPFITVALSEIKGPVREAICHVRDDFPVEAYFDALDPSAG